MRAGVWFKALPRIDRVLVELTIKVAGIIRSSMLAKCLITVVRKLEGLVENNVFSILKSIGYCLAEKVSSIAEKWGNPSAKKWRTDSSFAVFLAIIQSNRS